MASTHDLKIANLFEVKEFVCLITGGGTGIGLMAAQALAANGAKVYITGRRKEVLENAAQTHSPDPKESETGEIIPIGPCDVRSKSDLERLYAEIASKEKYLSLVITAAGIPGPKAPPESDDASKLKEILWSKESPEDWNDTYNTDVTSVYFTTVAFLPLLAAAPPNHTSSVIVISSMSGLMRHAQGHFAYNAAKGATAHLSKLMSREFAPTGVRVNSIAPGYFPSEMTMKTSDERNKVDMPDEKVKNKGHSVPAGRAGKDEEIDRKSVV